ncbi:hypothetical protein [Thermodesulfovibrio sp. TK110]
MTKIIQNYFMITLQCELEIPKTDKETLMALMRKFSSCMRYAYNRLLEDKERKDLQPVFALNSRYVDDAVMKAKTVLESAIESGKNPAKIIFGGRRLFNKLKKSHLNGKRCKKLKKEWKEKRLLLYSRGDKTKAGNLNLRFVRDGDNWFLRINTGNRQWIKAKVIRSVKRENDKWINFIWRLTQVELTGNYFPYSVEIKIKDGKFYANISYEEYIPALTYTIENGIIGLDINQSLNSDSEPQQQANQWKEPVRGECKSSHKLWKAVKVALGIPVLGKSFVRDLSPLRVFLVDWDRIPRRLVPVLGAGAMGHHKNSLSFWGPLRVSQIPPVGFMANLNWRNTNKPTRSVSFIHFC